LDQLVFAQRHSGVERGTGSGHGYLQGDSVFASFQNTGSLSFGNYFCPQRYNTLLATAFLPGFQGF
jgi:hypothetical protein